MLPYIFANNFRDPMQNTLSPLNRWRSPFISGLSFKGNYGTSRNQIINCDLEIVTDSPLAEDIIYSLSQLPSAMHTHEITYSIRVPSVLPECRDIYLSGLFTNSLRYNLYKFSKWEFLYLPFDFHEYFINCEIGGCDDIVMNIRGHAVHQAGVRYPSFVKGTLYLASQKYPSEAQTRKQQHKCFRSCIFK